MNEDTTVPKATSPTQTIVPKSTSPAQTVVPEGTSPTQTIVVKPYTVLLLAEDLTVLTAEEGTNLQAEGYGLTI